MSRELPTNPETEQKLFDLMWSDEIKLSFSNFVLHFFPWGEKGTPLEGFSAPRSWQLEFMEVVDAHCLNSVNNPNPEVFKGAISAGRGIGKTTLNAWFVLWLMSTRPGISVICLANSETQLKTTLWAEVSKWLSLLPNKHWFEMQSLSLHPAPWYSDVLHCSLGIDSKHYSTMCRTYSEERPDTFVGHHNTYGMAIINDEASGTPDVINLGILGFLTEQNANRFWIMTSNPRRLSGKFYEIFNKPLDDWKRFQIDTRTVEGIDPSFHEGIIARYGLDSDVTRVEVCGQFPQQDIDSFIPQQYIVEALERVAIPDPYAPLIMGCDIAGEGEDKTVVVLRRGNIIERIFDWSGELIEVTNRKISSLINRYNPDAIVIDGNGIGGTVVSYLLNMHHISVEVILGQRRSTEPEQYHNLRAELYDLMRSAITGGLQLPDDCPDLINELKSIKSISDTLGRLLIEKKRQGRSEFGVRSPDFVDALCYTFAVDPPRKDNPLYQGQDISEYEALDTGFNYEAYGM
ncbi:terminase large subunit [Liberibacter phage P-PA19-2]|nr:terminase large subunit [Liberibacter phage P-PA19-2]